MNASVFSSSSTSTVAAPLHSSSSQIPPDQAVTAQSLPQPTVQPESEGGFNAFFEKRWVQLSAMLLTGVFGYFAALWPLKDSINENKTEISVAKKEIEHIREDVKRMEGDVGKIPTLSTDIAVIRAILETRGNK